jgi:ribosomal protein L40E
MFTPETAETNDFKRCRNCGAAQIDRDKFCRSCGASQIRPVDLLNLPAAGGGLLVNRAGGPSRDTAPLSGGTLRRSYSGPLVDVVTQKLSEQTSPLRANRRAVLFIRLMVAAPLWLMIVLLSPLDAYVAAKDLASRL